MTTPTTTKSSRHSCKRSKQEDDTDFLDDSKLIVIWFSKHIETFKNN